MQILAPVVRQRKGEHDKVLNDARKVGLCPRAGGRQSVRFVRRIKLEKNKKHSIEVVVDRVVVRPDARSRITDSVEDPPRRCPAVWCWPMWSAARR